MTGFNIIMVIAIILFARLGVRLFIKWNELKKTKPDTEDSKPEQRERSNPDDGFKDS